MTLYADGTLSIDGKIELKAELNSEGELPFEVDTGDYDMQGSLDKEEAIEAIAHLIAVFELTPSEVE